MRNQAVAKSQLQKWEAESAWSVVTAVQMGMKMGNGWRVRPERLTWRLLSLGLGLAVLNKSPECTVPDYTCAPGTSPPA